MRSLKSMLPMAFICFFVWTVISCTKSSEGLPFYKNSNLSIEERINDLMPRMTIDEKVVQLATLYPNAVVRLGIPHIKAGEALHGICLKHATSFPSPLAMGSTWDPEIIENMGSIVAKEARALGTHQVYSPMLGILIDPRWGRSEESYGEDPYLVSRIGVGYIKGLQGTGDELFDKNHIIASAKHFAADGQPLGGLNSTPMDISIRRLHEVFFPPFLAAVSEANLGSVMPAHHSINGVPNHSSVYLIDEILRKTYGFKGHLISDHGDIRALHTRHLVAETLTDAARLALETGVDQELQIEAPWEQRTFGPPLLEGIRDGSIPVELVDRAVRNVLRSKFRLGLFDDGEPIYAWQDHWASGDEGTGPIEDYPEYVELKHTNAVRGQDERLNDYFNKLHRGGFPRENWEEVIYDKKSDAVALDVARKAITLIKNEDGLLPLDKTKVNRIAVIGPNADVEILGAYSTPEARHYVKVLDGIKNFVGNDAEILYSEGCSLIDLEKENIAEAVGIAKRSDVAILILGGNELTAREGEDTDTIDLPGYQNELVKAVYEIGTPVVVMFLQSRPMSFPWIAENISAILAGWFLGQETGTAVAEALFGTINPGGKLTIAIPRSVGQIPAFYNRLPGSDDTYRDSPSGPLYPFGHGLSYTTFEYSDLHIQKTSSTSAEVSVDITNSGGRTGDEVVQLYVHDQYSSVARPVKELKSFGRITLLPDATKTVTFFLDKNAFAFYDSENGDWVVEQGDFTIMVGSSSIDIRLSATLKL